MTYLKEIKTERPYTLSGSETTDLALFVRTSSEDVSSWNRQKIVEALMRETYIDADTAEAISAEIEEMLINSQTKVITAPLIRELVNAKLIERGLEQARMMHTRIGLPIYDVDQLILHPNKENANVPHGPEATNLTLAEGIKKNTPCSVFSPKISRMLICGETSTFMTWVLLTGPTAPDSHWSTLKNSA
jgi:Oxygen-sensitive ribonucleoside-triphosphate reductase